MRQIIGLIENNGFIIKYNKKYTCTITHHVNNVSEDTNQN